MEITENDPTSIIYMKGTLIYMVNYEMGYFSVDGLEF